jgi:hypothetical protein
MQKKRLIIGLATAAWITFMALNLHAAEGIRQVPVHFKKGASQAAIQGHIKGRETIDYVLNARAGQTMTVNLKTSNPMAYFNVLPPGSGEGSGWSNDPLRRGLARRGGSKATDEGYGTHASHHGLVG